MNFYLVLRHTENWSNLDVSSFFNYKRPYHLEFESEKLCLKANIHDWEKYDINFFKYRAKLKEIAQGCWPVLPVLNIDEALSLKGENNIFIPIDDDDIIHPDIKNFLSYWYKKTEAGAIYWDTWTYSLMSHRPQLSVERDMPVAQYGRLVPSNAYSLRGTHITQDLLEHHTDFSYYRKCSQFYIPEERSIRFVHPGGIWIMQQQFTVGKEYIYDKPIELPYSLEWGRDFIEQASELVWSIF